jgi:hypothetical protein
VNTGFSSTSISVIKSTEVGVWAVAVSIIGGGMGLGGVAVVVCGGAGDIGVGLLGGGGGGGG